MPATLRHTLLSFRDLLVTAGPFLLLAAALLAVAYWMLDPAPPRRVNIGAPGSGVPNLMLRLIEANRMDPGSLNLVRLEQTPAVVALLAGDVDALVFASAPESLMVQMLLQTPGIRLYDFAQADAY